MRMNGGCGEIDLIECLDKLLPYSTGNIETEVQLTCRGHFLFRVPIYTVMSCQDAVSQRIIDGIGNLKSRDTEETKTKQRNNKQ